MPNKAEKIALAHQILTKLPPKGTLGIGSGSTVAEFIKVLGSSHLARNYIFVAASFESEQLALEQNLIIKKCDGTQLLDVTIDGADSIIRQQAILIKGKGGAFVREKMLQYYSQEYWIIITHDKLTLPSLINVPIEIVPFAWKFLTSTLENFGKVKMRKNTADQPILSNNGNWIVDVAVPLQQNWTFLHQSLKALPGVIETGIFLPKVNQKTTLLVHNLSGKLEQTSLLLS